MNMELPYHRIEGKLIPEFARAYLKQMTRNDVWVLAAEIAEGDEEFDMTTKEFHAFVEGFCRGFFYEPDQDYLRHGDKEKHGWTSSQAKHIQNGSANGYFTRRYISGEWKPGDFS